MESFYAHFPELRDGGADEVEQDAAQFGIALPPPARRDLPVLPENWDTVMAFTAVQTQWRHDPSGHPTGLDYAACRAAVAAMGLVWKKVFPGLRVMEAETLEAIQSR